MNLCRGQLLIGRTIATGYYDGPTEGFTECSNCGQTFHFRMLTWDDGQDVRVFGFANLETPLDTIVSRLRLHVPYNGIALVQSDSDSGSTMFLHSLTTQPPVFAAAIKSWSHEVLACKALQATDLRSVSDWFAFLDMS
jgi:hypothetical protein